ncbi:BnaC09g51340D [Brassica napus]|uniref:BnaC09g51340D protein n=1 Tax=Brassica napus TaxID=3708 RepID=A0A078IKE5_BRANA|nr:BnaC09g51340D [Brassica napus]
MIRHNNSKKTKIGKDSNSLPPDLLIEILSRLPVKVASRFFLVSKLWSTIISSQDFIRSFPSHSIQPHPPRLLYAVNNIEKQNGFYKCHVHYVNGLISFGYAPVRPYTYPK